MVGVRVGRSVIWFIDWSMRLLRLPIIICPLSQHHSQTDKQQQGKTSILDHFIYLMPCLYCEMSTVFTMFSWFTYFTTFTFSTCLNSLTLPAFG